MKPEALIGQGDRPRSPCGTQGLPAPGPGRAVDSLKRVARGSQWRRLLLGWVLGLKLFEPRAAMEAVAPYDPTRHT